MLMRVGHITVSFVFSHRIGAKHALVKQVYRTCLDGQDGVVLGGENTVNNC